MAIKITQPGEAKAGAAADELWIDTADQSFKLGV